MKEIYIEVEYITLVQFLKLIDIIQSGGQAKYYLSDNKVTINNIKDDRRGRKLYKNDIIEVEGKKYVIK